MGDTCLRWGSLTALACSAAMLALVVGYIVFESRVPPSVDTTMAGFLWKDAWDPSGNPPLLGIGHAWLATFLVVSGATLIATPLALAIGVFLSEIASVPIRAVAEPALQLLAGIPAVVYGFVGYATLVPLLELWLPTGETLFAAALVLSLMILPFIAATAAEALLLAGSDLRFASLSLGASHWHTLVRVTLHKAAPGILAGVILGIGRGLGETLAVLMLSGNSPAFPSGLFGRGQPLTALIATDLSESAVNSDRYHALFSAGLLLMLAVIVINIFVAQLKRRFLHVR